jgi:hypothetical protein
MAKHTSDIVADDSYLKNMDAIENIIMIGYPTGIFDEANNLPVIRRGMKWSWFLGQICGLAKMYQVSVYATFRISAWVKYAMSGAKVAAKRVAELNTTFEAIVQEAEAQHAKATVSFTIMATL